MWILSICSLRDTEELERALKKDKAKCTVSPMSKLGLVEFSRKRTGSGPLPLMVRQCRHCHGTGLMFTAEFAAFGLRAKILELADNGAEKIRVDLSVDLFSKIKDWMRFWEDISSICGAEISSDIHSAHG